MDRYQRNVSLAIVMVFLVGCDYLGGYEEEGPGDVSIAPPTPMLSGVADKDIEIEIVGNTYYLAGENCDDDGVGDAETPFCTFKIAQDHLSPGDGLIFKDGIYSDRLEISGLSGEKDAPIIIRGENTGGVVFDGGCAEMPCDIQSVDWNWDEETGMISIIDSEHLILAGITVKNNIAAGVNVNSSNNITMLDLVIQDTGNGGILVREVSGIHIFDSEISRVTMGFWDEAGELQVGSHESISIMRSSEFDIAGNYIHDSPKEGIDIKENSINGEVRRNFIERMCNVGIYINEAFNVRVHANQIRRGGYYLDQREERLCDSYPNFGPLLGKYFGGGIQLAVGDLGDLSQGRLSEIQLDHNLIWNTYGNGIEFWDELRESHRGKGDMSNNLILNNVIFDVSLAALVLSDVTNSQITNNILALSQEEPIVGNAIDANFISHNLIYWEGQEGIPTGEHVVLADPLFANPSIGDFSLQAGSPAIDAGLDVGFPYSGVAPDLGAQEYGEENSGRGIDSSIWYPSVGTTWQWQLSGPMIDRSFDVDVYDLDLFETDASLVAALHDAGHKVICYISVGSWEDWRPDADRYPSEVIGNDYEGWPGEKWLDIRRIDILGPLIGRRFDLCKEKGFDAIEPDNIDGFTNDTGFPLSGDDQLRFNIWLAEEAHKRGLSIGLKNDPDQAESLQPYFDWALVEDCFAEDWCEQMLTFIYAGKPVFAAEYTDTGIQLADVCPAAEEWQYSLILKNRNLDAYTESCNEQASPSGNGGILPNKFALLYIV